MARLVETKEVWCADRTTVNGYTVSGYGASSDDAEFKADQRLAEANAAIQGDDKRHLDLLCKNNSELSLQRLFVAVKIINKLINSKEEDEEENQSTLVNILTLSKFDLFETLNGKRWIKVSDISQAIQVSDGEGFGETKFLPGTTDVIPLYELKKRDKEEERVTFSGLSIGDMFEVANARFVKTGISLAIVVKAESLRGAVGGTKQFYLSERVKPIYRENTSE